MDDSKPAPKPKLSFKSSDKSSDKGTGKKQTQPVQTEEPTSQKSELYAEEVTASKERLKAIDNSPPEPESVPEAENDSLPDAFPTPAVVAASKSLRPAKQEEPKTKGPMKTLRQLQHEEGLKLVRIRYTYMNPQGRNLRGMFVQAGNEYVGVVRKFIPFGPAAENGYHVPNIIYKEMRDRKYTQLSTYRDSRGRTVTEAKEVPAFAIEVLPPLTEKELKELANAQAAAGRID